jgi:hypothetical protein
MLGPNVPFEANVWLVQRRKHPDEDTCCELRDTVMLWESAGGGVDAAGETSPHSKEFVMF